ncbi:choice-of-anchor Q domain-containing protein [Iningainema tapete]|uniref:Right-handed parallel beta-helix repeat-containing protein n=1 Tax=Iningainema tapete BLCC-T55 TaxID=2748662 RepID=A0A8J6XUS9_9CYAN|nr:right-handed parallel beta-helix repeat-containing protein [Iningainema tapete]MBD2778101.1 right-handed parallel beta-helix repeat-containing protein [Iningainema tapete BLCC-T55]
MNLTEPNVLAGCVAHNFDAVVTPRNPLEPNDNVNASGGGGLGTPEDINTWSGGNNTLIGDVKDELIDGNKGNIMFARGNYTNEKLYGEKNTDLLIGDKNILDSGAIAPGFNDANLVKAEVQNLETPSPSPLSPGAPTNSSGKVYYVSPNGSDDNPGTSDKPWKTVNYAVSEKSSIKPGDTVLVQPGTYSELITLGKSGNSESGHITLKANGNVTLRDPDPINGGFREGVIQSANKGFWVIDGFRIENTSWAGIALRDANNMIVQNNRTYETGASGIIVMPETYYDGGESEVTSKNIKVLNNTIERANWRWQGGNDQNGTQEALSIWGVDGFEVANNTLKEGKREGLDIKTGSRNGSVHDNVISGQALVSGTPRGYNGGPALYVDGNRANSFNIDIYNNVVFNNTADGILIADEVPNQGDVYDIRVYNNIVYGNGQQGVNGGRGITVTNNVRNVEIVNNTVAKNVQAFYIDGADYTGGYKPRDVVLRNNIFANSTYRNGFVEDMSNLTLDRNLFTDRFEKLYEGGSRVDNAKVKDNTKVPSVGFTNLDGNNFRLSSGSPAINTGSAEIGKYAQLDKDGVPRNKGGAADIGAYEF